MKTIAFYISDYGYGHAGRSIAVIRQLLNADAHIKLIVCHSFALDLVKESLKEYGNRVYFREIATDVGYVLHDDSLEPDVNVLNEKVQTWIAEWDYLCKQEQQFLEDYEVVSVISDISPLGIAAAYEIKIPSIAISNFTWHGAYTDLINMKLLAFLEKQYEKVTFFFELAGYNERHWSSSYQQVGFFSRDISESEVKRIQRELNPNKDKLIVFFGLGMKVDVKTLQDFKLWDSPNCIFIVSHNVPINAHNVIKVPLSYTESQNYLAAADIVITKAGWGMISEALAGQSSLLLINRQSMKEDRNTIRYMMEHNLCKLVSQEELPLIEVTKSLRTQLATLTTCQSDNRLNQIINKIIKIVNEVQ
ncbi:glycosyltransferase [Priestia flexa]|uniref:glycosyltransferase n=1 Tax=Priestia flexa TaxID=86664 RepID=UPI0004743E94|nr:glycosyltransferase [Priestia flexa]